MGKAKGTTRPVADAKRRVWQAETAPTTDVPQATPNQDSEWQVGRTFESPEISAMHRQQEQIEIDRRRQEQAARERELADRD